MISKIGNWVFGSFFRTIGRLLVFIVLGIIIAHFIDFGSIKDNFRITDLFLEQVKADSYYSGMWQSLYTDSAKTNQYSYTNLHAVKTLTNTTGNNIENIDYYLNSPITRNTHFDHVYIPFMLLGETYSTATTTLNEYICSYQSTTSNGTTYYYPQSCGYQINSSNGSGTITVPVDVNFKFSVYLRDSQGLDTMCVIKDSYVDCALQYDVTYTYVRVLYNYNNANVGQNLKFGINRMFQLYNSDGNAITNSINQQTQQQQQQHQEIMDTNMTETNETASNFFGSFSDSDTGGLSGIITAPLVMINKMLDGVCVQPSATWKGATISLPCGDFLWSRNGASDLKNLVNVFYGGFICYYAIRKLFLMIENLKDPTQDKIEVTDL